MDSEERIQITLHQKIRTEKLRRIINKCDDISVLKGIAFELLNLNQQKTAIAEWSLKSGLKAEESKLKNKKID